LGGRGRGYEREEVKDKDRLRFRGCFAVQYPPQADSAVLVTHHNGLASLAA